MLHVGRQVVRSGGMGNMLREACWGGGTSVSSVSVIRLSSEQELGQRDLCVCVRVCVISAVVQ